MVRVYWEFLALERWTVRTAQKRPQTSEQGAPYAEGVHDTPPVAHQPIDSDKLASPYSPDSAKEGRIPSKIGVQKRSSLYWIAESHWQKQGTVFTKAWTKAAHGGGRDAPNHCQAKGLQPMGFGSLLDDQGWMLKRLRSAKKKKGKSAYCRMHDKEKRTKTVPESNCYSCGQPGHFIVLCPKIMCSCCNKMGHRAKNPRCYSQLRVHRWQQGHKESQRMVSGLQPVNHHPQSGSEVHRMEGMTVNKTERARSVTLDKRRG